MSTGQGHPLENQAIAQEASVAAPQLKAGVQKDIVASQQSVQIEEKNPIRTTRGLWIFDKVLYNITNLAVFAFSVFVTYKTNLSQDGNFLEKRTKKVVGFLQDKGFVSSEKAAQELNMVLWSFIDGSIAAPFVAKFKQHRSEIGRWIDDKLGTTPLDKSVYDEQPKEGWKSVILGRITALAIVLPTWKLLSIKDQGDARSLSLNEVLFERPAKWLVKNNLSGIPGKISKAFPNIKVEGLAITAIFEAFYTTVCTSVLFAVSYLSGKRDKENSGIIAGDSTKSIPVAAIRGSQVPAPGAQPEIGYFNRYSNNLSGKSHEISHIERYKQQLTAADAPLTVSH